MVRYHCIALPFQLVNVTPQKLLKRENAHQTLRFTCSEESVEFRVRLKVKFSHLNEDDVVCSHICRTDDDMRARLYLTVTTTWGAQLSFPVMERKAELVSFFEKHGNSFDV